MNIIKEKLSDMWEYFGEAFPSAERSNKFVYWLFCFISSIIYQLITRRLHEDMRDLIGWLSLSILILTLFLHELFFHKINGYRERIKSININLVFLFCFIMPIYLSLAIAFLLSLF